MNETDFRIRLCEEIMRDRHLCPMCEEQAEIGEIAGPAQCEGDHGGDLDDDEYGGQVEGNPAEIAEGLVVVGIGLPKHGRRACGGELGEDGTEN